MPSQPSTPAPDGLADRGAAFWRDVTADYDLTDAELHLLHEACRTLDDLDRLAAMVAEHGVTVKGSAGQPVANPAMTEARGQRLALHRLVAALALPDPDDSPIPTPHSIRSVAANRARWSGRGRVS